MINNTDPVITITDPVIANTDPVIATTCLCMSLCRCVLLCHYTAPVIVELPEPVRGRG